MESLRPHDQRSQTWIDRDQAVVAAALAVMDAELGDHHWCMGTPFTFADVAVGCALGYLDFRFPDIDWRAKQGNLARLYEKVMQRPSFAESVPTE